MRNIFSKKKTIFNVRMALLLPILTFVPVMVLFVYGISSVSLTSRTKARESLEETLNRDIVHCYAVEGVYPPSLDFIEQNYGLEYDTDMLYVDYVPIASNIYPDVTVIDIGKN